MADTVDWDKERCGGGGGGGGWWYQGITTLAVCKMELRYDIVNSIISLILVYSYCDWCVRILRNVANNVNIYLTGRLGFDLHLTLYEAEQDKKLEHSNEVFYQVLYWICVRLRERDGESEILIKHQS